jgi:hypothetical protein
LILELKIHEELFFHYLTILSLIPSRRENLLYILDVYGKRIEGDKDFKKNSNKKEVTFFEEI